MKQKRLCVAALVAVAGTFGVALTPAIAAKARGSARSKYATPGAAYVGVTSQLEGKFALPVDVRASSTGRTIKRVDIQWTSACSGSGVTSATYSGLSVTLNRKITTHDVFTNTSTFTKPSAGDATAVFTIKLYGRVTSPHRVAGTLRVTVAVSGSSGQTAGACDSGIVTWTATH